MAPPHGSPGDPAPPVAGPPPPASAPTASLVRTLGLGDAISLGLGSILGTGVFVSLATAAGVAGGALPFAIALAALVALANGLSSAHLAAVHPVSGGTYEYGYRFVHPHVGFAAGWMFVAAKSASAATAALGATAYLLHLTGWAELDRYRTGIALALVLSATALVASGVRRSNRANAVIVALTLGALATFIVAGIAHLATREASPESPSFAALAGWSPASFLHATALVFVAFTGYGRVATLGEEVRDPSRTIPRAIVATLGISVLLYLAVAGVALASVGAPNFAAFVGSGAAPLVAVAATFGHPWVAVAVAVGALTAMIGVLLNLILGLSRVWLAMARRNDLPSPLASLNTRQQPARSVWAAGTLVAVLVLTGDLRQTWSFSAFTVLVYYGITHLAALRVPANLRHHPRWLATFGLTACLGLAAFIDPPIAFTGLAVLAAGFLFRSWMHRTPAA